MGGGRGGGEGDGKLGGETITLSGAESTKKMVVLSRKRYGWQEGSLEEMGAFVLLPPPLPPLYFVPSSIKPLSYLQRVSPSGA